MKKIIQKPATNFNDFNLYLPIANTFIRQVIFFLICCFILFWFLANESDKMDTSDLEKDGYIVISNASVNDALSHLPKGYMFLNYKYIIRGCSLSTFHRDVTSSPYIYNTSHPVYTFILYKNPGSLLSVCPGSHRTTPFLYSSPVSIKSNPENTPTGILFHCDLVHAGAINENGTTRYVEQYKIAHVDDIPKLAHLQNINITKKGDCNVSYLYEILTRKLSWIFSHIFNHHFTPYLQNRPDNHIGKMLVSLYGREFYNA